MESPFFTASAGTVGNGVGWKVGSSVGGFRQKESGWEGIGQASKYEVGLGLEINLSTPMISRSIHK